MTAEPRVVWMPGGVRTEIHLSADDTAGAFCLLIDEPPAGWSLPSHRHRNETEVIHVIQGEFEMTIEHSRSRLAAGQTVLVPPGVTHASRTSGDRAGRRMVIFTPAGIERFFLEAGAASPQAEVDLAVALASATRYGWEFVPDTTACQVRGQRVRTHPFEQSDQIQKTLEH